MIESTIGHRSVHFAEFVFDRRVASEVSRFETLLSTIHATAGEP